MTGFLWSMAQEIAKEEYEKEFGVGTWDEADKREREDWVFNTYKDMTK